MSEELALKLNDFTAKGYVIAPAGYGKTHLIAMAVKVASKRQLILTHTFAGVNSIKTKMTALGVPSSKYQIDTIASWSLRLCLAYPKTSGWKVEHPASKPPAHSSGQEMGLILGLLIAAMQGNHTVVVVHQFHKRRVLL